MRELESRLRSMEGTLARKEADLTAFAEMLQQSLHTAEEAAIGEHTRFEAAGGQDPTQRLGSGRATAPPASASVSARAVQSPNGNNHARNSARIHDSVPGTKWSCRAAGRR